MIHIQDEEKYPGVLRELKYKLPIKQLKRFYTDMDIEYYQSVLRLIRLDVIDLINRYSDGIHITILNKETIREPTWTSVELGNYIFAETIQKIFLNKVEFKYNPKVYFDMNYDILKTNAFINYMFNKDGYYLTQGIRKTHFSLSDVIGVSSIDEPGIWAADFLAGAYYDYYNFDNPEFFSMIDQAKLISAPTIYFKY